MGRSTGPMTRYVRRAHTTEFNSNSLIVAERHNGNCYTTLYRVDLSLTYPMTALAVAATRVRTTGRIWCDSYMLCLLAPTVLYKRHCAPATLKKHYIDGTVHAWSMGQVTRGEIQDRSMQHMASLPALARERASQRLPRCCRRRTRPVVAALLLRRMTGRQRRLLPLRWARWGR